MHAKNLFISETKKKKLFQDTFFLVLVGNQINLKIYILFIKPSKLNFLCFHRWKKCRNLEWLSRQNLFFQNCDSFPFNFPQNVRIWEKIKGDKVRSVKKNLNFWGKDQEKSQNSRKKLKVRILWDFLRKI